MLKISKNKKIISSFFLLAYAVFLLIFSLHYHRYDLNESLKFKDTQKENSALVLDFLSNGLNICAVNHFFHTILNYSTTSEAVNFFLSKIETDIYKTNYFYYNPDLLINISPRASPLFS